MPQVHEKVFPITANCLRLAWGRARAKAEIKDLRFHDLRHEAISRFFEMGMSVPWKPKEFFREVVIYQVTK